MIKNMDRLTRKKKITVRGVLGSPGSISVAGGTSPGSPQRSSNDYVRNDERIIGARATSRAVKATGDQKHGEREGERERATLMVNVKKAPKYRERWH